MIMMIQINKLTIKASDTLEHQPTVWPVSNACAQPYHPRSGNHGELFRPCRASSAWHSRWAPIGIQALCSLPLMHRSIPSQGYTLPPPRPCIKFACIHLCTWGRETLLRKYFVQVPGQGPNPDCTHGPESSVPTVRLPCFRLVKYDLNTIICQ